jgi:hypothetical protein
MELRILERQQVRHDTNGSGDAHEDLGPGLTSWPGLGCFPSGFFDRNPAIDLPH